MSLRDIVVLIPSHSLEDFPTEQPEKEAASLLNSFAVAWHPELLAQTEKLPRWQRADETASFHSGQLFFVPTACDGWLSHHWLDDARAAGATVISGVHDREEMISAALGVFSERVEVAPDLISDFFSLGFCWLQVELLTRRMRNYGNSDETRLQVMAIAAAKASLDHDRETAETHLRACFELLQESREKFYPVECYLIDLCLLSAAIPAETLANEARRETPWSLLATASDLDHLCKQSEAAGKIMSTTCRAGGISIVGGEDRETPLNGLPLESAIYHFTRGLDRIQELFGQRPVVWGRRKYALTSQLPQLLTLLGYHAALHVVIDDGIYPDAEHSKFRWRGSDETVINSMSRIPLAADSASTYLRFPVRMAESMDHDQVAGLMFARWPDAVGLFFEDLRRSSKYAPVLGRFVTLDQFFEKSELPGQLITHQAHEYFSPYLIQSVARRESNPLSRFSDHVLRRRRFDAADWCRGLARAFRQVAINTPNADQVEKNLESAAPDADVAATSIAEQAMLSVEDIWPGELAHVIVRGGVFQRGFMVFNSLSFTRRVCLNLPSLKSSPGVIGPIKAVQFNGQEPHNSVVIVDLPGAGFVWIPEDEGAALQPPQKHSMVEGGVLQNEWFEVSINEQTGGIRHVRLQDQRTKRLSQQISFRFPHKRTIANHVESLETEYAEMRCRSIEVLSSGPLRAEISTTGEIVDQTNGERLATFRQTTRIWRTRPIIEIDIELSDVQPPDGDPWNNYFAVRFAWNDATSAVSRSIFHSAQGFGGERFETSDYVEVASDSERLTIVPHGLPFHRRTGTRMLDSLLIVEGEQTRSFRFTLAIDKTFPLETAWNATTPVNIVSTENRPPGNATTGWFFHLDARNVQLTRILGLIDPPPMTSESSEREDTPVMPSRQGFAVRLLETEGRSSRIRFRTFRQPLMARKRDLVGKTLEILVLEGDSVLLEMRANEIAVIELRY